MHNNISSQQSVTLFNDVFFHFCVHQRNIGKHMQMYSCMRVGLLGAKLVCGRTVSIQISSHHKRLVIRIIRAPVIQSLWVDIRSVEWSLMVNLCWIQNDSGGVAKLLTSNGKLRPIGAADVAHALCVWGGGRWTTDDDTADVLCLAIIDIAWMHRGVMLWRLSTRANRALLLRVHLIESYEEYVVLN